MISIFYFSYTNQLRKASAYYYVAYSAGVILSFGWIMDRLMYVIIEKKSIVPEEHQALQRIGKAICSRGLKEYTENLYSSLRRITEEFENIYETERLGDQFLKSIDKCNELPDRQNVADQLLIILHDIALNNQ